MRLQNVLTTINYHMKTAVDVPARGGEGGDDDVGSRAEKTVAQTETNGHVSFAATGVEMQTTRKSSMNGKTARSSGCRGILLQ